MLQSISMRLAVVHVLYMILYVFAIGKCQNRKLECPRDLINTPCSCKKAAEQDGLDVTCEGAEMDQIANLLEKIPRETIIKNMRLHQNHIVHLPGLKFQHLHIHKLSITRSNVQDIDSMAFFNLDHTLHELDLSSNLLNTIPHEAIKRLKMLKTISFSWNLITRLQPNTFAGMTSLLNIYLTNNEIEDLDPYAFNDADNLTKIQLSHNKLRELPGRMLSKLSNLQELYMTHNSLTDFPEGFFQGVTSSLEKLHLNHNLFREVPPAIASLQELEVLNMNHNCLEDVASNAFSTSLSSQLGVLDLSSNNLTRVPVEALTTVDNLESLSLQNNSITSVPDYAFKALRSLKYLYLHQNKVENVSAKALTGLKKLEWLYLSKNSITTLRQETFQEVKHTLRILDIHDNPLKCDCKLKWIIQAQWAQLLSSKEKETKCREPREHLGMLITRPQNYPQICEPIQTEAQKLRKDPDNNRAASLCCSTMVSLVFWGVFLVVGR